MKIIQKNEILEDEVSTSISVQVLGTKELTAAEELELLHDFKYNLEYKNIDFSAEMALEDGTPVIVEVAESEPAVQDGDILVEDEASTDNADEETDSIPTDNADEEIEVVQPTVEEPAAASTQTITLKLINESIPVDENFKASLKINVNSIRDEEVGEIINSKKLVAQAKLILFAEKIKEELENLLKDMRKTDNKFEGEEEYTL
jgi:C-terminal processing protease CtpA/Prc